MSEVSASGKLRIAEAVRTACQQALQQGYEQAAVSGLCHAGAWECALGALQTLDLPAVIQQVDASGAD